MDSDSLSEGSPVKRHKASSSKPYRSDEDSGDELLGDIEHDTVATIPLQNYRRPIAPSQRPQSSLPSSLNSQSQRVSSQPSQRLPSRPTQRVASQPPQRSRSSQPSKYGGGLFSQTLRDIASSSNFGTQPTQRLPHAHPRSSPEVEVMASSPPRPSPPRRPMMAPPGTVFRPPQGLSQPRSQSQTQSASQRMNSRFDDPPVPTDSDDDIDNNQDGSSLRPTNFTRGQYSSSSKSDFAKFAYRPDDLASAYGRSRPADRPRQTAPAKAAPVEMTVDDITNTIELSKVKRMQSILTGQSLAACITALRARNGNVDDAMTLLVEPEPGEDDNPIDLTSEADIISAPIAHTKQDVRSKQTIRDRHKTHHQQQQSPVSKPRPREQQPQQQPQVISSSPVAAPKPRRRLMKGRRAATPDSDEVDPIQQSVVEIQSDDSDATGADLEDDVPLSADTATQSLLNFINTSSPRDFADLANCKEQEAELVLSQRPFKRLSQIRTIRADGESTGGRRKTLGERLLDASEIMWEGYEAVDKLASSCDDLAVPIYEAMKKWNIDSTSLTANGELNIKSVDHPHDSGIGTPASSISDDDYLQQPRNMSTDLVMKDYQVFGLNWLNLLWSKRLSCILADDMGLGKTCQVISFLGHLKATSNEKVTSLVIVPGSTLENWLREIQRFCPELEVEAYYGGQKEREEARWQIIDHLEDIDIILTTYDMARNKVDNHFLRKDIKPHIVVLDEGHMLKNANSDRYIQLMRIPAEFRLLLTGTPLQNNLLELASLLGFILPQLFEESKEALTRIFNAKATTTDETSHTALLSRQRIDRARKIMAPFILRRKKAQVLSEMPAKHRRVELCSMMPAQRKLWNRLYSQAQADRAASAGPRAPSKSKTNTNSVHMTELRFCALHPLLLREIYTDEKLRKLQKVLLEHPASEFNDPRNTPELMWKQLTKDIKGGDYGLHRFCYDRQDYVPKEFQLQNEEWMTLSGKIPILCSMLDKWIAEGSRTLLFSQFTTMLDILESVLATRGIKFVRLDGSTVMADRQPLIDLFTEDESIKVFMLSTKAGGAGINLAAANKVVIIEGGFNPQDEVQAENRAHRVGQTREVEVVRLVTRKSIETKIYALAESKLALDEKVGQGIGTGGVEVVERSEADNEKKAMELLFASAEADEEEEDDVDGGDEQTAAGAVAADVEEEDRMHPKVEDVKAEDAVEVKDGDVKMEEVSSSGRPKRKRTTVQSHNVELSDDDDDDDVPASALKKRIKRTAAKKHGGDISKMFRKELKGKGLDVA